MKDTLVFVFIFSSLLVYGQDILNNEPKKSSEVLNKEGKALLSKEKTAPFDKVVALGKFRKSLQRIGEDGNVNHVLNQSGNIEEPLSAPSP